MKPYLSNLTALRGIAAILVVVLHVDFFLGAIIPRGITGTIDKLYLMVDFFFILSGFVMCYAYENSFNQTIRPKEYKRFLLLRLARIYPLHLVTLLASVGLCLAQLSISKYAHLFEHRQAMYQWGAIPTQLTFLETFGIHNFVTWNSPAWSLSAEWWSYTVFPALFFLTTRFRKTSWLALPTLAVGGWLFCEYYLAPRQPFISRPPNPDSITLNVIWRGGFVRGLAGFIAGIFVFRLYRIDFGQKVFARGGVLLLLTGAALALLHTGSQDTLIVCSFSLIILSAAHGSPWANRLLSTQPLQRIGDWSFSIYLWHMIIINLITACIIIQRGEIVKGLMRPFENNQAHALLALAFCLTTALIIGKLSYQHVEKPARDYLRKKIS